MGPRGFRVTEVAVQNRAETLPVHLREGMLDQVDKRQGGVVVIDRLIRKPEEPRAEGRVIPRTNSGVMACIAARQGKVFVRNMERNAFLRVVTALLEVAHAETGGPGRMVSLEQEFRVAKLLRKPNELVRGLARALYLANLLLIDPHAHGGGEQLGLIADLFREVAGA
jgi:hypothetical protein